MPRFAAIDIGTNSIKMTAAEVSAGGVGDILAERVEITRLGRGVDATKQFADEAVSKTLDALRRFVDEARGLGVEQIRAGGTSAMRDATNGESFRQQAAEITGGEIEVITGEREARLTFLGAMSDPKVAGQGSGKILAFDVGGGSTELIVGTQKRVERSQSLDIGAVRLTERTIHIDPPTPQELADAQLIVDEALAGYEKTEIERIVGIGGTATTVAAMLKAEEKDNGYEGLEVTCEQIDNLTRRLSALTLGLRRNVAGLDPERADVILAGMLIIRRILTRFDRDSYIVSTRGVRYGLLLEMAS